MHFKGFPPLEKPVHIAPLVHHFIRGILIDEECRTDLAGLFAAGEVTGGIHGANRLRGNALTDCVVFGAKAGQYAAEHVKTKPKSQIDEREAKQKLERISQIACMHACEEYTIEPTIPTKMIKNGLDT